MNDRDLYRKAGSAFCIVALMVCGVAQSPAQSIYKQTDAAGRITYTNLAVAAPSSVVVPSQQVSRALARNAEISTRAAATIDANEARRRLLDAQLALARSAQSRDADSGATNRHYLKRQEKLQRAVELAQRRASEIRPHRRRGQPASGPLPVTDHPPQEDSNPALIELSGGSQNE